MSVFHGIALIAVCAVNVALIDPGQGFDNNCDIGIPRIYLPACGSDGKIYSNEWELEYMACKNNVTLTVADPSTCPNFPDGYEFLWADDDTPNSGK